MTDGTSNLLLIAVHPDHPGRAHWGEVGAAAERLVADREQVARDRWLSVPAELEDAVQA